MSEYQCDRLYEIVDLLEERIAYLLMASNHTESDLAQELKLLINEAHARIDRLSE